MLYGANNFNDKQEQNAYLNSEQAGTERSALSGSMFGEKREDRSVSHDASEVGVKPRQLWESTATVQSPNLLLHRYEETLKCVLRLPAVVPE